jgi:hypothetical protein
MAKKQPKEESNLVLAMLEAGRRDGPDPFSYSARDAEKFLCGVEYPALSLMWLTSSNVLYLSKVTFIAGPSQSQKSSLGYEMLRWVIEAGGYGDYVECEGGKYSKGLIESIIGYDHIENNKLKVDQCMSIDEAQTTITSTLKLLDKMSNKDKLFAFLVDSLMGVETEESFDKFFKEGYAGRNFPAAALSWTAAFKNLTSSIVGCPVALLFINHLKEKPPAPGAYQPTKTTPGGVAQRFHSSVYFWVKRTNMRGDTKVELSEAGNTLRRPHDIREIQIECDKNSFGVDGRKITVNFIFYHDDEGRQHSFFDWDASTAKMLWEMCDGDKCKTVDSDVLHKLLDLRVDANLYSSGTLGLKRVTAGEFGHAIHTNLELMEKLKDVLHIKRHNVWNGTMPYTVPDRKPREKPETPDEHPEERLDE